MDAHRCSLSWVLVGYRARKRFSALVGSLPPTGDNRRGPADPFWYSKGMDDPERDTPRPAATSSDIDYTLSLEEVSERYARAGHPRTLRTLQRYCVSGHLDAQKVAT